MFLFHRFLVIGSILILLLGAGCTENVTVTNELIAVSTPTLRVESITTNTPISDTAPPPQITSSIRTDIPPTYTSTYQAFAGRIFFQNYTETGTNAEIYVTTENGTDFRYLTTLGPEQACPSVSPDGNSVAFIEFLTKGFETVAINLFVRNTGGSDRIQLTTGPYSDGCPAWSPDAQWIAFVSNRNIDNSFWNIYLLNLEDNHLEQVTGNFDESIEKYQLDWSPDGTKLAFTGVDWEQTDPLSDLYILDIDTGVFEKLDLRVDNAKKARSPSWSPDGSRIAFVASRDDNADIYIIDLAENSISRLTNHAATDTAPTWSPDGQQIAFQSNRDGSWRIYVMSSNGGGVRALTDKGINATQPLWVPFSP